MRATPSPHSRRSTTALPTTQAVYRARDRKFHHPEISKIKLPQTVKLTPAQKAVLNAWRKENRWSRSSASK
jgi:hypothetical protein